MEEFIFSNFYKIIKKYTNKTYSDLELVYFLFGGVNKDKESERTELRINKSQVSRILSRVEDVPKRVRDFYCDDKNHEVSDDLFERFLDEMFEEGKEDQLLQELKCLYSGDDNLADDVKSELDGYEDDDYSTYFSKIYTEVLKINNKASISPIVLYSHGKSSVNVITDDLLKISLYKKYVPGKKIVVIPVNTSFNMHLSNPDDPISLVSETTLHGKWIARMKSKGLTERDICAAVNSSLDCRYGTLDEYPIGAISVVRYEETYFYLLAVCRFDENGRASCDMDSFYSAINSLIENYNNHGQGYPIYVPLMGTGMTRLNLSYKESLDIIKDLFISEIENICGSVNIVIYNKDKKCVKEVLCGLQK